MTEEEFLKARRQILNDSDTITQDFINRTLNAKKPERAHYSAEEVKNMLNRLQSEVPNLRIDITDIHEEPRRTKRTIGRKWRLIEWVRSLI